MNQPTANLIDRKQICAALKISRALLEKREEDWGLVACRSKLKTMPMVYFPKKVNAALIKAGIIDEPIF